VLELFKSNPKPKGLETSQNCVCEGNGMEWNGIVHGTHLIPKKFFLKLTQTFLLFTSNQLLFITFQIKKSLQNKIFHFFI
jgi:hypothetical protein